MKEQVGAGEMDELTDTDLTIPGPSTRMERDSRAGFERVGGGPMSSILEAWRMSRKFGRGPFRLKKSFSTSQLRRQ